MSKQRPVTWSPPNMISSTFLFQPSDSYGCACDTLCPYFYINNCDYNGAAAIIQKVVDSIGVSHCLSVILLCSTNTESEANPNNNCNYNGLPVSIIQKVVVRHLNLPPVDLAWLCGLHPSADQRWKSLEI